MKYGHKEAAPQKSISKGGRPPQAPAGRQVRLGAFIRFIAVVFVPTIWIGLGWGSWIDLTLLIVFLLMASPPASLLILVLGFLPVVISVPIAQFLQSLQVDPPGAYAVATAVVCVVLLLARRLLDTSPEAYLASPKALGFRRLLLRVSLVVTVLACAATLLRSVPLERAIAWAVVFGCSAWRLRPLVPAREHTGSSRTARAGTIAMIAISTVLSLAVVEVGARIVLPPSRSAAGIYMGDSRYLFLLEPNGRATISVRLENGDLKPVEVSVSSQGIREQEVPPKQPDEFRIAMLGDSHTMGHAVAAEFAIPKALERRLQTLMPGRQLRVLNAGIGGGGPLQELGMLRERVLPLDPDLVILQVYPGNDIENALEPLDKRQRAYDKHWHQVLADHKAKSLLRVRLEKWMFDHSRAYQALRMATGTRCISDFIGSLRFAAVSEKIEPPEDRPFWIEANLKHWYPELEEGLVRLEEKVRTMRDECRARGIDFIAYCMPDCTDVSDKHWTEQTTGVKPATEYERLKAMTLVETFLKEEGIYSVSVLEPLRAAGPVSEVYYMLDGHLTELGNATVGNVLGDYLAAEYFPRKK